MSWDLVPRRLQAHGDEYSCAHCWCSLAAVDFSVREPVCPTCERVINGTDDFMTNTERNRRLAEADALWRSAQRDGLIA